MVDPVPSLGNRYLPIREMHFMRLFKKMYPALSSAIHASADAALSEVLGEVYG